MANTFQTPSVIARMAIRSLMNNLVMAGLVYRDYDREYRQVGDTINVRNPATLVAKDYPTEGVVIQNVTESSVSVVLNKHKDVEVKVTSKERALSLVDFQQQVVDPAMRALADQIDRDILSLYAAVPYQVGTAGTTPDGMDDLANVRKSLVSRGCPLDDLALVLDPEAEAKMLQLDALVGADKSGSTDALRRASLGTVFGLGIYMDQNVPYHTTGGDDCAVDNVAGYAAGTTTIHVDGLANALVAGDLLTLGGVQYTVVSVANWAAGDLDVTLDRGLEGAVANDAAITVAASHRANLGFHRHAFCLATAPLEPPMSGQRCEVVSWNGVSIRVVYDWDASLKSDHIAFDCLYGVKCLDPKKAVRLLG